jgi:hypothetical protein
MWEEQVQEVGVEAAYQWVTLGSPGNSSVRSKCDAPLQYDYHIAVAVSCGMMLLFGIVYSLFGESGRYKILKMSPYFGVAVFSGIERLMVNDLKILL